jgi:hypothetical protein
VKKKKKKTLVLTLGSLPERAEIKTLAFTLGSPRKRARKKKNPLTFTLGSPPDLDFRTWTDRQRPMVTDGL